MSLNLKNEETHRLARELATLTGQTVTAAVTDAVRERLERVRRARSRSLAERLMVIGRDCAAHLRGDAKFLDHGTFLYDERGMPR